LYTVEKMLLISITMIIALLSLLTMRPWDRLLLGLEEYEINEVLRIGYALENSQPIRLSISSVVVNSSINLTVVLPHETPIHFNICYSRLLIESHSRSSRLLHGPPLEWKYTDERESTVYLNYSTIIVELKPIIRLFSSSSLKGINAYFLMINYVQIVPSYLAKGLTLHLFNISRSTYLRVYIKKHIIHILVDNEEIYSFTIEPPAVFVIVLQRESWICD